MKPNPFVDAASTVGVERAMPAHFSPSQRGVIALAVAVLTAALNAADPSLDADGFRRLFPEDGVPKGWVVTDWSDLSKPPAAATVWKVEKGVLFGGEPRGTWLVSTQEFKNFELEFEFKLGERGNSGCALRVPMKGDPAFDGMELQMADVRYNPEAKDSELTGGLYRALAPSRQVYRPTEWNRYHVTLSGAHIKVILNGETIQDVDLSKQETQPKRHDGTPAPPLKDRPKSGHIGFQELSREGSHVQIRGARIKELP